MITSAKNSRFHKDSNDHNSASLSSVGLPNDTCVSLLFG